jgi:hypothetical protein
MSRERIRVNRLHPEFICEQTPTILCNNEMHLDPGIEQSSNDALGIHGSARAGNSDDDSTPRCAVHFAHTSGHTFPRVVIAARPLSRSSGFNRVHCGLNVNG